MDFFQSHYLFSNLSHDILSNILRKSELMTIQKDTVIYMEGNNIDDNIHYNKRKEIDANLYVIYRGSFKIFKKSQPKPGIQQLNFSTSCPSYEQNDLQHLMMPNIITKLDHGTQARMVQVQISIVGTGSVIGLEEIINNESKRRHTVIANEVDCQIYRISMSAFGGRSEFMKCYSTSAGGPLRGRTFCSRSSRNEYINKSLQNYEDMFLKKKHISRQSFNQDQQSTIIENLLCHQQNFLKTYKIKIGMAVKSLLQTFRKDHIGQEVNDLAQFKEQKAEEERCRESIILPYFEATIKGIHHNRLREYSSADKAYMVFEQYKGSMLRYNVNSQRKWVNEIEDKQNELSIKFKPSTAVKNTKRKLKHSRRQVNVIQSLQLNQHNFI